MKLNLLLNSNKCESECNIMNSLYTSTFSSQNSNSALANQFQFTESHIQLLKKGNQGQIHRTPFHTLFIKLTCLLTYLTHISTPPSEDVRQSCQEEIQGRRNLIHQMGRPRSLHCQFEETAPTHDMHQL